MKIYYIALHLLLLPLIISASDCPVRVISRSLHHRQQHIPNDTPPPIDELNGGGGQFAPPPWANNTGMISSELFEPLEPINFRCQFIFVGAPEERVQLIFHRFHLHSHSQQQSPCEIEDHVTAHVLVGARMSKIYDFCGGKEIPPQLMSANNLLTLDYIVKSGVRDRKEAEYGFRLEYRFIQDYGRQPEEAIHTPNESGLNSCAFVFNGSVKSAGDLWSPNYPGFYPRQLECSYEFIGGKSQIILISFEYFDVEGFGQCEESTHSDYVLFSNYKTTDRTNRRYCGAHRPPQTAIASESNYFRMQFFSNDIFDGTGFYAHYQFLDLQNAQRSRVKLSNSGGDGQSIERWLILAAILLVWMA